MHFHAYYLHETFPTVSWCHTIFVLLAVCPKCCTNLYKEREKVPSLENASTTLMIVPTNLFPVHIISCIITIKFVHETNMEATCRGVGIKINWLVISNYDRFLTWKLSWDNKEYIIVMNCHDGLPIFIRSVLLYIMSYLAISQICTFFCQICTFFLFDV